METKQSKQAKEIAKKEYPVNFMIGSRSLVTYLRANGDYAVRMFLPAGEMLPNEALYAYVGPDVKAARNAWRSVVAQWDALYVKYAADTYQGVAA